jgi:hypothetical protein
MLTSPRETFFAALLSASQNFPQEESSRLPLSPESLMPAREFTFSVSAKI